MMNKIVELLGKEADELLKHRCETIPRERLHVPGSRCRGSPLRHE